MKQENKLSESPRNYTAEQNQGSFRLTEET